MAWKSTKWSLLAAWVLSSGVWLGGCSSSSSGGGDEPPEPQPQTIDDPLISAQWYLRNTGQSAYTESGQGGMPGEDINAFSTSSLTPDSYAHGVQGREVEIAIVDTGLDIRHEDLADNVILNGSYNFNNNSHDPTPNGIGGDHGTSVAGLAAGRGGNGIGIWGVAPSGQLRGFNLLSSDQDLTDELAALGYQPSTAGYPGLESDSVSVFNKSYGTNPIWVPDITAPVPDSDEAAIIALMDALQWGAENLRDGKGALYVKAGGNEYETIGDDELPEDWCSMANDHNITCFNVTQETENNSPYQMIIGAFNAEGKRSSYSNTGSALWLAAPGGEYGFDYPALMTTDLSSCEKGYSQTYSAVIAFNRGQDSKNAQCNYYSAFNGTSSATPVVSGVVALLLEANPDLTWRDVKHILATTARRVDADLGSNTLALEDGELVIEQGWVENAAGYGFSNTYGFGAVNALDAVQMALDWKNGQIHRPDFVIEEHSLQTLQQENVIPSGLAAGLVKSQTIDSALKVESVMVRLDITATTDGAYPNMDPSDYLIELTSPSGTRSILLTPFNAYQSGHNMVGLILISHAFYGEDAAGDWQLKIVDVDSNDRNRIGHVGEGKLDRFQLTFYGYES